MWFYTQVINMAELNCDLGEEKKIYCKIRGLFGKYASEIQKSGIDLVNEENTLHIVQLQG
jgi:hypothetical protein